ncbi:hypothetical protein MJO29_014381 [Puccinia striiformis f. sp. tritici]
MHSSNFFLASILVLVGSNVANAFFCPVDHLYAICARTTNTATEDRDYGDIMEVNAPITAHQSDCRGKDIGGMTAENGACCSTFDDTGTSILVLVGSNVANAFLCPTDHLYAICARTTNTPAEDRDYGDIMEVNAPITAHQSDCRGKDIGGMTAENGACCSTFDDTGSHQVFGSGQNEYARACQPRPLF